MLKFLRWRPGRMSRKRAAFLGHGGPSYYYAVKRGDRRRAEKAEGEREERERRP